MMGEGSKKADMTHGIPWSHGHAHMVYHRIDASGANKHVQFLPGLATLFDGSQHDSEQAIHIADGQVE